MATQVHRAPARQVAGTATSSRRSPPPAESPLRGNDLRFLVVVNLVVVGAHVVAARRPGHPDFGRRLADRPRPPQRPVRDPRGARPAGADLAGAVAGAALRDGPAQLLAPVERVRRAVAAGRAHRHADGGLRAAGADLGARAGGRLPPELAGPADGLRRVRSGRHGHADVGARGPAGPELRDLVVRPPVRLPGRRLVGRARVHGRRGPGLRRLGQGLLDRRLPAHGGGAVRVPLAAAAVAGGAAPAAGGRRRPGGARGGLDHPAGTPAGPAPGGRRPVLPAAPADP